MCLCNLVIQPCNNWDRLQLSTMLHNVDGSHWRWVNYRQGWAHRDEKHTGKGDAPCKTRSHFMVTKRYKAGDAAFCRFSDSQWIATYILKIYLYLVQQSVKSYLAKHYLSNLCYLCLILMWGILKISTRPTPLSPPAVYIFELPIYI